MGNYLTVAAIIYNHNTFLLLVGRKMQEIKYSYRVRYWKVVYETDPSDKLKCLLVQC